MCCRLNITQSLSQYLLARGICLAMLFFFIILTVLILALVCVHSVVRCSCYQYSWLKTCDVLNQFCPLLLLYLLSRFVILCHKVCSAVISFCATQISKGSERRKRGEGGEGLGLSIVTLAIAYINRRASTYSHFSLTNWENTSLGNFLIMLPFNRL